jgi:hypothetical protein
MSQHETKISRNNYFLCGRKMGIFNFAFCQRLLAFFPAKERVPQNLKKKIALNKLRKLTKSGKEMICELTSKLR